MTDVPNNIIKIWSMSLIDCNNNLKVTFNYLLWVVGGFFDFFFCVVSFNYFFLYKHFFLRILTF